MKVSGEKMRIDKYLALRMPDVSRSRLQKMIRDGSVLVNGVRVKASYVLKEGDDVDVREVVDDVSRVEKQDIDLRILYECKDFMVIDKPAGVVVHPGESGHTKGTVVNALLDKIDEDVGEVGRPGIVHRLDKDTSGVLIVAKTKRGYKHFVEQFKGRKVRKVYLALVKGELEHKEGVIDSPISRNVRNRKKMGLVSEREGKRAVSRYKIVKEYEIDKGSFVSLVEVQIETGRTHQIRVHMAGIGHPVIGDNAYGTESFNRRFKEKFGLKRQFLHAEELEFVDLDGKKKKIASDLPKDLDNVLTKL